MFIVIAVLSSCDAPRLNPLDPLGQNYTRGQIDGYVFSYPHAALSGVRVTWKNENISVETDSKGYYSIKNVSTKSNGIVYIEKNGFAKDTIQVQWNNQKSIRLNETVLDYTAGKIKGTVKAAFPSSKALANVKVTWKSQNVFTYTNTSGSFTLSNIPFEDGWIIFEIDGYSKDSTEVVFGNQRDSSKVLDTKYLNSVPTLNSFVINTSVENNISKNYYMIVSASIKDIEKDVDNVLLKCDELGFSKTLNYNPDTKCYEGTYQQNGLEAIQNKVGKAFSLIAVDGNGRQFSLGSTMITRLIKDQVSLTKPANEDIVTSLPITLEWESFSPGFSFHYFAKVYYNNHNSDPVWSQDNISSNDFKITIGTKENPILTDGYYIWELWCVDAFGNKTRSMLADFYIQTE